MATDKVAYWLDIADYDYDTAEAMYMTGRWLYVAFMCHQVIEKTLEDKEELARTLTKDFCRQIIDETKTIAAMDKRQTLTREEALELVRQYPPTATTSLTCQRSCGAMFVR